ncbi:uncharacterized protein MONOS_16452 [Monocercomonoides exilis]|uniref:uncharacterized protein n=1 Tax=Monocercomonoides exilis TaxID=2049356 RepID=UPI003559DE0A|nr:hypothetical protein MONOS_16452 [Monocercomonoides exilis]|eukprot:MONOS_16452.1-p1 / transcript=MONOS_16452.1 / gene=MONOS_16452 / organism=Monocercomonoides_exilis_PA203 / gene_product=unspecified product / transcript_product=unspecified product / location=Mono_scaffold01750:1405-2742(+) / protein_length=446 / sequence_SO=supercontig / SO=protein_coding / is_pseudo=false
MASKRLYTSGRRSRRNWDSLIWAAMDTHSTKTSLPFHALFPLNTTPRNTKSSAPCPSAFTYTPPPFPAPCEHWHPLILLLLTSSAPASPSTNSIIPPLSDLSDRHASNTLSFTSSAADPAGVSTNTLASPPPAVTLSNDDPFTSSAGASFLPCGPSPSCRMTPLLAVMSASTTLCSTHEHPLCHSNTASPKLSPDASSPVTCRAPPRTATNLRSAKRTPAVPALSTHPAMHSSPAALHTAIPAASASVWSRTMQTLANDRCPEFRASPLLIESASGFFSTSFAAGVVSPDSGSDSDSDSGSDSGSAGAAMPATEQLDRSNELHRVAESPTSRLAASTLLSSWPTAFQNVAQGCCSLPHPAMSYPVEATETSGAWRCTKNRYRSRDGCWKRWRSQPIMSIDFSPLGVASGIRNLEGQRVSLRSSHTRNRSLPHWAQLLPNEVASTK